MSTVKAYKNDFGRWVYTELPENMRPATVEDFRDSRGNEKTGIEFLVHGYYSGEYEHHRSAPGVIQKFLPWIEGERVYVKI